MDAVGTQIDKHGNQARAELLKSVYKAATGNPLPPLQSEEAAKPAQQAKPNYEVEEDKYGNVTLKHKTGVKVILSPPLPQ